jgi:DnaJ-class molecular chaperone
MRELYDILGVRRDASDEAIKRAYRKLAKALHPDLNPGKKGLEARFKDVTAAYDILSDPEKRARYDRGEIDASGAETAEHRFRRARAEAGMGRTGPRASNFEDLSDVFADLFGDAGPSGARGGFRGRGEDARYELTVSLADVALGATRRLTLPDRRTLDVAIPAGIEDGQTLRLGGQGVPGLGGGAAGDAYVRIRVAPDAVFERKGDDLHMTIRVSLPEAVLGARIEVPTIDGQVTLTIPKGSNGGKVLRLKGKGVRHGKGERRGDQLVTLDVALPERPDAELTAFAQTMRPYAVRRVRTRG